MIRSFSLSLPISLKRHFGLFLGSTVAIISLLAISPPLREVQAQVAAEDHKILVRADVQEADSETGIITARGNVQVNYPARKLQATAAIAQYYTKERRLILTGNVYVLQEGNSIRAEKMIYSIDEGRFIATPKQDQQVESIYIIPEAPESRESASN